MGLWILKGPEPHPGIALGRSLNRAAGVRARIDDDFASPGYKGPRVLRRGGPSPSLSPSGGTDLPARPGMACA